MKMLSRFNPNSVSKVLVTAKEHEWGVDLNGKFLYKVPLKAFKNIELYYRVNYNWSKNKSEIIPFNEYMDKLPEFFIDHNKKDFKPGESIEEWFCDLSKIFDNVIFINVRNETNFRRQYIIKFMHTINGIDYTGYIVFYKMGLNLSLSGFNYENTIISKLIKATINKIK